MRGQWTVSNKNSEPVSVTVSVGATWVSPQTTTKYSPNQVLQMADDALYEAKKGGRDTVRYIPLDEHGSLNALEP